MASRNGAFIPTWSRENTETGEMEFALAHEDFEAIRQGYGCATCLADYHGVVLLKCPQCGETRKQTELVVPQWWTSRSVI